MPRRAIIQRREVNPDPKYGSRLVAKFINVMMHGGKRSLSEAIMYHALDLMADRAKQDPLGGGGLPGIDMRHDADVARPIQRILPFHRLFPDPSPEPPPMPTPAPRSRGRGGGGRCGPIVAGYQR